MRNFLAVYAFQVARAAALLQAVGLIQATVATNTHGTEFFFFYKKHLLTTRESDASLLNVVAAFGVILAKYKTHPQSAVADHVPRLGTMGPDFTDPDRESVQGFLDAVTSLKDAMTAADS